MGTDLSMTEFLRRTLSNYLALANHSGFVVSAGSSKTQVNHEATKQRQPDEQQFLLSEGCDKRKKKKLSRKQS
jgi:hypothetical protein